MGFHFEAQGDIGVAQSKAPSAGGQPYNYHAILYSMSCKELARDQSQPKRRSAPAIPRRPVPHRSSSLPVPNLESSRGKSTAIHRRPVPSMSSALPRVLQAGVNIHGFDVSSWIESTIEELQHPYNTNNPAHKRGSPSLSGVPWMQEQQDTTITSLQPRTNRETPIYSEPGSAIVSFPYCGCEGLGSAKYHKHSSSADLEIRPPSPLFSHSSSPRCSGSTLVDTSDSHSNSGSIDTFGRPRATSGTTASALASERQGFRSPVPIGMKPLPEVPVPIIGAVISPTVFSPTETEGCPSMPCTPGLVLDAQAARISAVRPTMVEVPSPSSSPRISPRASLESTPSNAALPTLEPLVLSNPPSSPDIQTTATPLFPPPKSSRRKLSPTATTTPATTPLSSTANLISPLWGISDHSLAQHSSTGRHPSIGRKLSAMATSGIVADIAASVQDFPARMLCLDTPCIVSIRHYNHGAQSQNLQRRCGNSASASEGEMRGRSAADSTTSRYTPETGDSERRRFRQGSGVLAAPLPLSLRAGTPPPPLSRSRSPSPTPPCHTERGYSPTMDMLSYYHPPASSSSSSSSDAPHPDQHHQYAQYAPQLPTPDLSVLATIFPASAPWYQNTLYAHLIAYNHLRSLHSLHPLNPRANPHPHPRAVPAKAARMMGIPALALLDAGAGVGAGEEGEGEGEGYKTLLEGLETCMVRVMKCMMGKREGLGRDAQERERQVGGSGRGGVLGRGELALVRALGEVVRGVEG